MEKMRDRGAVNVRIQMGYASVLAATVTFPDPFPEGSGKTLFEDDDGDLMEAHSGPASYIPSTPPIASHPPDRDQFEEWYDKRPLPTLKI